MSLHTTFLWRAFFFLAAFFVAAATTTVSFSGTSIFATCLIVLGLVALAWFATTGSPHIGNSRPHAAQPCMDCCCSSACCSSDIFVPSQRPNGTPPPSPPPGPPSDEEISPDPSTPTRVEEPFTEASELWLSQLDEEKRLVEALPCVKGAIAFHVSDGSANKNKVLATVWCCWEPSRRTFKQIAECCNETGEKPTHLEALRALRAKLIDTHGRADHEPNARAVDHRADLERNGAAEEVEPKTAFDRMWLARAADIRCAAVWCR